MAGTHALNVLDSGTEVSSISDVSTSRAVVAYPDTRLSEEEKLHKLENVYISK